MDNEALSDVVLKIFVSGLGTGIKTAIGEILVANGTPVDQLDHEWLNAYTKNVVDGMLADPGQRYEIENLVGALLGFEHTPVPRTSVVRKVTP